MGKRDGVRSVKTCESEFKHEFLGETSFKRVREVGGQEIILSYVGAIVTVLYHFAVASIL